MLLFVLLHATCAFLTACACASRLAAGRAAAIDVLSLVERTLDSLMGTMLFLVFGLAKKQVLWAQISDLFKRCGRKPPRAAASAAAAAAPPETPPRSRRRGPTSFDVNEQSRCLL